MSARRRRTDGEDRFGIVGRVIAGAYHVERVVAEGGFGVVYRAHHGGFRAPIALKCLKVPQHLDAEHQARFLEQFRAEAEVMFRLSASTPNVVRPLHVDVMTTPNGAFVPFLVLEWLEGETLDAIIRGRRGAAESAARARRGRARCSSPSRRRSIARTTSTGRAARRPSSTATSSPRTCSSRTSAASAS